MGLFHWDAAAEGSSPQDILLLPTQFTPWEVVPSILPPGPTLPVKRYCVVPIVSYRVKEFICDVSTYYTVLCLFEAGGNMSAVPVRFALVCPQFALLQVDGHIHPIAI